MATSIEELREFLTEDEIAAIEADDEEAANAATGGEPEGDQDDEGDEDQDEGEEEQGEGEGDEANAAKAKAAEPEPETKTKADPIPDVTDLDERITQFKADKKAILDEYRNGDIDDDELETRLDALEVEADKVKAKRANVQMAIDSDQSQWISDAKAYFKQHPGLAADSDVLQAYDSAVRYITGNPAFANLTNQQVLARAHQQIQFDAEHLGLKDVPPAAGTKKPKKDPAPAPKPKPAARESDIGDIPKTLANVPSSDISGTGDSKYASLQRLIDTGTSDEIEAAMSKLSEEEREAFSSADV